MLFISWNINGLTKRFEEVKQLLEDYAPDFLCLQKVRSNGDRDRFEIDGYRQLFVQLDCGDWSGVSIYVRLDSDLSAIPERIDTQSLSRNGHLQVFECKPFALINTYVPFGNLNLDGAVEYRCNWDTEFRAFVKEFSSRLPIIICGDMNIVHTEFDNFERKLEQTRPNFTKWERDNFNRLLLECDLVDPYRLLHPTEKKPTYFGAWRHLQMGNRIDYFLISRSLMLSVRSAEILSDFSATANPFQLLSILTYDTLCLISIPYFNEKLFLCLFVTSLRKMGSLCHI